MLKFTKILTLIIVGVITSPLLYAQGAGYVDDFEDGILTGWSVSAEAQRTYELAEENGVLQISYHRTSSSWEWDVFMLNLPQNIDVSSNPRITMEIKSDISTVFTIKPHYTNGNNGWIQEDLSTDNVWHTYTFDLSEANYTNGNLSHLAFYFDGGTNIPNAGTIYFDNFQIAAYSIEVYGLTGEIIDSTQVNLSWDCDNVQAVNHYNIFRGNYSGFPANVQSKIGETTTMSFQDDSLSNNTTNYYLVTAVDTSNNEYPPSNEFSIRLSTPGVVPSISVITSNSEVIGKYEKFELTIELEDATYQNPYNYEEIALFAYFTSPAGDTLWVNGYYDEYQQIGEWKIRFSPDSIGQWQYRVYVTDVDGTASSEELNFSVQESDHHGWLQVSPNNPHYLVYDDGEPFYGVGVYYPWGVTESGLDDLVDMGANYFAYWNGNYDFEGGRHQIESARTGIGYYDQDKCGRIDQILQWAEERNLKMQFAIWPHDVLDETVWGYNGWEDNAYKYVCASEDFFSDSTSWEYQKKLYRYIIARWGYSRSMAVWELVNEIHGTDGWVHGNQAMALEWVENTHDYFKELDPHKRPTTIDKGRYWSDAYEVSDMPSVHLYEEQWVAEFPNDHFRSSYWTYANVANQFYTDYQKPGIMAEAGGEHHFYADIERGTDEYTLIYHNALWASWSNGLAISPLWWWYGWMRAEDLQQMQIFSTVAQEINYAQLDSLQPADVTVNNADGFFMESDTTGFGWIRAVNNGYINGNNISLSGLSNGTYQLSWIDTWTGNSVDMDTTVSFGEIMPGTITHELNEEDIALLADRIDNGNTAEKLNLFLEEKTVTYLGGDYIIPIELDSLDYTLVCFVTDNQKRLVTSFDQEITFSLEGPGQLEDTSAYAHEGGVVLDYWNHDSFGGEIRITAAAEGLDTVVFVTNVATGVDENQYQAYNPNTFALYSNYPNPFNSSTHIRYHLPRAGDVDISVYDINGRFITTLVEDHKGSGTHSATWNSEHISSGVYFIKLMSNNHNDVIKCTLIK